MRFPKTIFGGDVARFPETIFGGDVARFPETIFGGDVARFPETIFGGDIVRFPETIFWSDTVRFLETIFPETCAPKPRIPGSSSVTTVVVPLVFGHYLLCAKVSTLHLSPG